MSLFIHPIGTAQALRDFQKKVAEVQSQISEREARGLVRDPLLDTAYQDLESLHDNLQQAQEKLFDVGVVSRALWRLQEEIDKTEGDIRGILDAKLVYEAGPLPTRTGIPFLLSRSGAMSFWSTPKLNSSPLSSLFRFVSFDLTSDRGILYGINRHNSSLILFDRFSLENYKFRHLREVRFRQELRDEA